MVTKFTVIYFVNSDIHPSGGYFTLKEFDTRSEADEFALKHQKINPKYNPLIWELQYLDEVDPLLVCEECKGDLGDSYSKYCSDCCEHEYDWDEGYTCSHCGEQGDIGGAIDEAEYLLEDR